MQPYLLHDCTLHHFSFFPSIDCFCQCIKQWRDPSRKPIGVLDSGNTKRCPMCRAPSRFITPSSKFWADGSTEKQKTVESYRESMRRVQCRFFQKSIRKDRLICPFGNECFYQHKKPDGTIHVFRDGVEDSMRVRHTLLIHNICVNTFYSRSVTASGTITAVDLLSGLVKCRTFQELTSQTLRLRLPSISILIYSMPEPPILCAMVDLPRVKRWL